MRTQCKSAGIQKTFFNVTITFLASISAILMLYICPVHASRTESLFSTGNGTDILDKALYEKYESVVRFTPNTNMNVYAIRPHVYTCNGKCVYEVIIKNKNGIVIGKVIEREARVKLINGSLENPIQLFKDHEYEK